MDNKVKGAWLVHQTAKLQNVTNHANFENTYTAGKAGILLSALSSDKQLTLKKERVRLLAQASNINRLELNSLLETLENIDVVDVSKSGDVSVLGINTQTALEHTAKLFESFSPTNLELAAIELSEASSCKPHEKKDLAENLSDSFRIPSSEMGFFLDSCEKIGFVDVEKVDDQTSLYFNGNLFRRDDAWKIHKILETLSSAENTLIDEFNERLKSQACIPVDFAKKFLGEALFVKVCAVGMYDINVVSNTSESTGFITKPSAFSKYNSPLVEDAFDLAKAFVSSLTYGMTRSAHERGRIRMIEALLGTLIRGEPIGPVSAIGNDYRVLEVKNVVQVYQGSKGGRTGHMMRLLKRDVGILALEVIKKGDVSEHSLSALPTAIVTHFVGPEENRTIQRKRQTQSSPKLINDMLMALRTGAI
ncbi:hypothetical protein [Aeromonas dhakensis]|uniref:hypothetical protein n=1 Tax=Aeromonas dhakensis TaxID=196024 RepID=UPI000F520CA7|nr:hypothetical protein [Aeromonas dhakensis]RQM82927.1 hypothetical protein EHZ77_14915 [Aeromonas dhakensis]